MTRYDIFRKRIAPILFLGMVGLIAYDACDSEQRAHSKIVLDLGDARDEVRRVDAELIVGGDVINRFHKAAISDAAIGELTFEAVMPEDTAGTLRIDVELGGKLRTVTRTIRPVPDSTTTVSLGGELRSP